ncbi:hypothetical protein TSC_c22690 [Thermus scotoductus SA-01]|uniref:Uncharacterized protein n=1 Tax=Thermus scotoductus (strain ATCC 700910 / SA-01) TaxID=743525 RepID=E8PPM3_THESS|nr:hypothetical protein TSC_c22690 [Thermus scotoductus SA-01]
MPYAGAGVEGDLWLIGNEAGFLVYPHGLLGLELVGGTAIELRLGYLVFAGQSSAGSFAFGFGLRNPLY